MPEPQPSGNTATLMCGLCGVFSFEPVDLDDRRASISAMTALMSRRGPDDERIWSDGRHLALGFRRLAIIDVSERAHQPFVSSDGEHVLVFNGELYNFRELRAELRAAGAQFRTESDTEVVLEALRAWGAKALSRFNGMFALAWYERTPAQLLLARDPMGIKPLYFLRDPRGIVFGSQYDQVIRHPWCERSRVDREVLGLYLRLNYMPAPYGIIENTGQLEPGTYVEVTLEGSWRSVQFYALPDPGPELLTGANAVDAVSAAVDRAVGRQLVSDVPIGSFLSGGIDSPLVTGAMRHRAGPGLPAFSIGTDDAEMDESAAASSYAKAFEVEHHLVQYRGVDALSSLSEVVAAFSEPFADYSAFPSLAVSALARSHVKTVLSGDGGDELFWGYPRFWKVLKSARYFHLPRPLRAGAYFGLRGVPERRPARGVLFPNVGDWYLDAHSGLRHAQLRRVCPAALRLPASFGLYHLEGAPPTRAVLSQWLRRNELYGHLQMVLLKMDRSSMHYGLEVRVPMLDLETIETAMQVHPDACMHGGLGKQVLRAALARRVEAEHIPGEKKGFTVPLGRWFREELHGMAREVLSDSSVLPEASLDADACVGLLDEHVALRRDHTRGLWALVALKLWAERHLCPLPAWEVTGHGDQTS